MSDKREQDLELTIEEWHRTNLSRRRLLRGAGAGIVGLSLVDFLAACGSTTPKGESQAVIPKGTVSKNMHFSNWPLYIDEVVLKDFKKKYGTSVKYVEEINDNQEFFGKVRQQLAQGQSGGRDMFVLTDWMAARMKRLGYVQKLDKSALPNVEANLLDSLRHPGFDPEREYSVPWQTGMSGLIYRADKIPEPKSVNEIFNPKYKGKVTMLSELNDTVGLTMLGMDEDPSSAGLDAENAAIDKIDKANKAGQIRRFTGNDYTRDLTKGDAWLVYGWSGDAVQLQADNKNIRFVIPDEGVMLWADNMQIPVGAPHAYTAEVMMNYVYDPEVQAKIAAYVNYVTPVKGTKEVIAKEDPDTARNQLIFPSPATLEKTHIFRDVPPDERAELDSNFQRVIGA